MARIVKDRLNPDIEENCKLNDDDEWWLQQLDNDVEVIKLNVNKPNFFDDVINDNDLRKGNDRDEIDKSLLTFNQNNH